MKRSHFFYSLTPNNNKKKANKRILKNIDKIKKIILLYCFLKKLSLNLNSLINDVFRKLNSQLKTKNSALSILT